MTDEWRRYCDHLFTDPDLGISVDVSGVRFDEADLTAMGGAIGAAVRSMAELEAGAIANPDEKRMVGHYWLRAPDNAPTRCLAAEIRAAQAAVASFADRLRTGRVSGADGTFLDVVHVGIGGSALGPQLLHDVFASPAPGPRLHFLDNSDPDAVGDLLCELRGGLGRTLVSVVSKSGYTPTPRLVVRELEAAYATAGLDLARHAVATTMTGSDLDALAARQGWLARFPLWDWVGGRTSVTSPVGLLPAALTGADVYAFLDGAAAMDRRTRTPAARANPAALLALMWFLLGGGRGAKNMVIIPYRDRLARFPRYVRQLLMESVGKRLDRAGRVVHQGLTVYGHKGSTDQHAYMQQLHHGPPDFFVTFLAARRGRHGGARAGHPEATLGDHLHANLEGTRAALYEHGRDSITITLPDIGARSLGALLALFERAVGLYAELIDVNAYHQPGVDKNAAAGPIASSQAAVRWLAEDGGPRTAQEIAEALGAVRQAAMIHRLLEDLARSGDHGIVLSPGASPRQTRFSTIGPRSGEGGNTIA